MRHWLAACRYLCILHVLTGLQVHRGWSSKSTKSHRRDAAAYACTSPCIAAAAAHLEVTAGLGHRRLGRPEPSARCHGALQPVPRHSRKRRHDDRRDAGLGRALHGRHVRVRRQRKHRGHGGVEERAHRRDLVAAAVVVRVVLISGGLAEVVAAKHGKHEGAVLSGHGDGGGAEQRVRHRRLLNLHPIPLARGASAICYGGPVSGLQSCCSACMRAFAVAACCENARADMHGSELRCADPSLMCGASQHRAVAAASYTVIHTVNSRSAKRPAGRLPPNLVCRTTRCHSTGHRGNSRVHSGYRCSHSTA